jgi:eukaryotic-like serine/threonine-protein kinase
VASSSIELGTIVHGTYLVDAMLGEGGMAVVYRARHLQLGTDVALKVMKREALRDPDASRRFLREAQHATGLNSEHVARILDVGRLEDGMPFILMEFLAGADLGTMLEHHVSLSTGHAVDLVLQACDAVAEAHSIGIIHRDIKPTNLFVTMRPDGSQQIKLLDFGISKSTMPDMSLTQTASLLGTPSYMSPEQMRSARRVDQRTDIWSLGCVLYELVEGRRPFNAETFSETCVMVAVDPPDPMRRAPELEPIIQRCLAKLADGRYPSVAALAVELAPFADDQAAAAQYVARTQRLLGGIPAMVYDDPSGVVEVPLEPPTARPTPRPTPPPPTPADELEDGEENDTIIAPTDAPITGPASARYDAVVATPRDAPSHPPPRVFISAGIGLVLGLALVLAMRFTVFKPRAEIDTEGETVVLPTERVTPPLPIPDAPAIVAPTPPAPTPAPPSPVKRSPPPAAGSAMPVAPPAPKPPAPKPPAPKPAPPIAAPDTHAAPEVRAVPEPTRPESGSAVGPSPAPEPELRKLPDPPPAPVPPPPPPAPRHVVPATPPPTADTGSEPGSAKPPCGAGDSRAGC